MSEARPIEAKRLRDAFKAETRVDMSYINAEDMGEGTSVDIRLQYDINGDVRPYLLVINDQRYMRVRISRQVLKKLKTRLEQETMLYGLERGNAHDQGRRIGANRNHRS